MTRGHVLLARLALAAAATLLCGTAAAQAASTPASAPHRHLDPGMPSAAARTAAAAEKRSSQRATGAALDAEVRKQLRGSFDAADVAHRGTLTRAQARAGGFGYVAQHFDAIDVRHAGAVSFDDLQRYLQSPRSGDIAR